MYRIMVWGFGSGVGPAPLLAPLLAPRLSMGFLVIAHFMVALARLLCPLVALVVLVGYRVPQILVLRLAWLRVALGVTLLCACTCLRVVVLLGPRLRAQHGTAHSLELAPRPPVNHHPDHCVLAGVQSSLGLDSR